MKRAWSLVVSMIAVLATLGVGVENASADRAKVGTLRCNLGPSVGLIVVEKQRLSCTYTPDGPFPPETYFGSFTTVGAQTVSLPLNAGANTIEIGNPSAYAPDFNEIVVAAAPS